MRAFSTSRPARASLWIGYSPSAITIPDRGEGDANPTSLGQLAPGAWEGPRAFDPRPRNHARLDANRKREESNARTGIGRQLLGSAAGSFLTGEEPIPTQ
jgi:hypothetical protein